MDFVDLKELNEDCTSIQGRYEILKIKKAMGANVDKELSTVSAERNKLVEKLQEQKDAFNVTYKDVRDAIFKDFKKKNVNVSGFVRRIGDDGKNAFYAGGLVDLNNAKIYNLNDLEAAQKGFGAVIAIVVQPIDKPNHIIESEVYNDVINVLDSRKMFNIVPLEIKNYTNFVDHDSKFDDILWSIVEKNFEVEKQVQNEVEQPKQYQSTLHIMDKTYVRPYSQIGYFNESKNCWTENKDKGTEK